jgi:8-oxo-dGTP diphosphatase
MPAADRLRRLPLQRRVTQASSAPQRIVVTAAVIERDDAFLVTRRPSGVHLEGFWEFPGGKCEPGESHAASLVREIAEELDATVLVGPEIFAIAHTYPDRIVQLHFFQCELTGEPRAVLGQEMRWVPRGELRSLAFPPADEELIRKLASRGSF